MNENDEKFEIIHNELIDFFEDSLNYLNLYFPNNFDNEFRLERLYANIEGNFFTFYLR
jgi:hypothetical protein